MRFNRLSICILPSLFLTLGVPNADAQSKKETIELSSGPAPLKSIIMKIKEPFEKETGITINLMAPDGMSAPNVIIAVESKRAEVGVLGADWNSLLDLVEKNGHKLKSRDVFQTKVIGNEPTNFIVHPDGPATLSDDQIFAIFTGKAMSWKDIGGKDVPIQIAAPQKFPATQQMISDRFLKKEKFRPGIKFFGTFEEINEFVATTPGAIGFGSAAILSPKVKQPAHSKLDRPTHFVTLGEPSERAKKLLEFIEKFQASKK